MNVYDLKTEHLKNPMGIDAHNPRFSWKISSSKQNVLQESYEITAYSNDRIIWNSGIVETEDSQGILYAGEPLLSGQVVTWKVKVTAGGETAESKKATFEMGLLNPDDWQAKWIEPEEDLDDLDAIRPAPLLRKKFTVKPNLTKARIYQSAHGLYEFWMNGELGTADKFKPGFTSYYSRIQYQTYDITDLLPEGDNVWAIKLADGWWRGVVGGTFRNNFGYKLAFIGQIILDYADGSREIIASDESFKTSTGALLMSDMKMGDTYDARLEPKGWKYPEFDDSQWKAVHLECDVNSHTDVLIPSRSVPVREKEQFIPNVFKDVNGDTILDFGQNIAGYVRITVRNCKRGQKIILQHGEDMKNGAFYMENALLGEMGDHLQMVEYICQGGAIESYQPDFSIFGFRYVKLTGYEGSIEPGDFVAVAVYSACEETGDFVCSNPLINQLIKNSRWSQKGNFMDVPTDCPTRERSPWTGDSQVYCKTASLFMDVYPFFEKWMQDLNLEQMEDGKIANTFPSTNTIQNMEEIKRIRSMIGPDDPQAAFLGDMKSGNQIDGSAGWGDAATINPYTLYLCYGDKKIIENQYESARKWVDYIATCAKNHAPYSEDKPQYKTYTDGVLDADYLWDTGYHWGEWLEADIPIPDDIVKELIDHPDNEVPTAYYYYSAKLLSEMAKVLDKEEDAIKYKNLSENVRRVFNKYLIHEDGSVKEGRQAPNVRALEFGIPYEENRQKVADKLAEYVKANDYHLNTGFLATPFLLQQLCDNGYQDYAFKVLEQESAPGWIHNIIAGGTTIPEVWNGFDSHFGSFNHYSYGAVCNFMFSRIAGIQPVFEKPGYKHFIIKPVQGGTLTFAEAVYESIYGTIRSSWRKTGDGLRYEISIPANTTATVILPDGTKREYGSGDYILAIL